MGRVALKWVTSSSLSCPSTTTTPMAPFLSSVHRCTFHFISVYKTSTTIKMNMGNRFKSSCNLQATKENQKKKKKGRKKKKKEPRWSSTKNSLKMYSKSSCSRLCASPPHSHAINSFILLSVGTATHTTGKKSGFEPHTRVHKRLQQHATKSEIPPPPNPHSLQPCIRPSHHTKKQKFLSNTSKQYGFAGCQAVLKSSPGSRQFTPTDSCTSTNHRSPALPPPQRPATTPRRRPHAPAAAIIISPSGTV